MNLKHSTARLSRHYLSIIRKRTRFHLHQHYLNQLQRESVVEKNITLQLLKDDILQEVLQCLITRSVREMVQRNGRGRGLEHIENECMKRKLKELLALTIRNQYRAMKVQIKQIDIQASKEQLDNVIRELQGKVYHHPRKSKQKADHSTMRKIKPTKNVPQPSARFNSTSNNCIAASCGKDVGTQVAEVLQSRRKLTA